MNPETTRTPECQCLHCGCKLDSVTGADGNRPRPGSITVCMRCSAVMKLDDELKPRGMTDAEVAEIVADPQMLEFLGKVCKTIQMMPKMN